MRRNSNPKTHQSSRWQVILSMPPRTRLWDLSTGQYYRVDQLRPLYQDARRRYVNEFQIRDTGEKVFVGFLRLVGETLRCSLQKERA